MAGIAPRGTPAWRATRNARICFCVMAAASSVATHWPRLALAAGESPVDKLAHASSFALLSVLLWRTRWVRRIPVLMALMAAWATLDEVTQAIPVLHRHADLDDWLADLAGIAVACAFVAAFRPMGHGLGALFARRRACALDGLLSNGIAWFHLATAAALGAAAGAPLGVLADSWFQRKAPQPWQYGFIGAVLGAGVAAHALLESGIRWRMRRNFAVRPCLACGTPHAGTAACAACGRAHGELDWCDAVGLDGREEGRLCVKPVALGIAAVIVLNFAAIALLTSLRLHVGAVMRFDRWFAGLPTDARILADATGVALVGAWALAQCRGRIAGALDRGGARCLRCGFDLQATAPGEGGGRCPECGTGFVRVGNGAHH